MVTENAQMSEVTEAAERMRGIPIRGMNAKTPEGKSFLLSSVNLCVLCDKTLLRPPSYTD